MNYFFSNSLDNILRQANELVATIEKLKRPDFIKPEMCRYFNEVMDDLGCHGILDSKTPKSKERAKAKKLNLAIAFMYRLGFFVEKLNGKIFTEKDAAEIIYKILNKPPHSNSYYSSCKTHATEKDYDQFGVLREIEAELKKIKAKNYR